jgi:methylenetetrahydrofolate dehydrogenase (NADP+)/methenyltetrahydrofolate cyclohydrolase
MIINGKAIAQDLLQKLKKDIDGLKQQGITPTLAVILVGKNPESLSYVRQKQFAAEDIGARLVIRYQLSTVDPQTIQSLIREYNKDLNIHGVILQRPLPEHLQNPKLLNSVKPEKDIDGFVPGSKFKVPVALAVEKILQEISKSKEQKAKSKRNNQKAYDNWIKQQNIVVIGRGETAGKPIADYFKKQGYRISVIHSQTSEKEKQRTLTNADIIISCVGKERVVTPQSIKQGAILISVGIWRDSEGKLHGDYEEDDIKDIASFYTPTPGGVGPVNVSCLMQNLVTAANSVN